VISTVSSEDITYPRQRAGNQRKKTLIFVNLLITGL
jgi:hypothetical protein